MPRGRPRKLRPDESYTVGSTAQINLDNANDPNVISTTNGTGAETESLTLEDDRKKPAQDAYSYLKPYIGKESLVPNEPRFFVNGRKLIAVIKDKIGVDDQGKPHYAIRRKLHSVILDHKPQGKALRQILKRKDIPGA